MSALPLTQADLDALIRERVEEALRPKVIAPRPRVAYALIGHWDREDVASLLRQGRIDLARDRLDRLHACLVPDDLPHEIVDRVVATIAGSYTSDTFPSAPWKAELATMRPIGRLVLPSDRSAWAAFCRVLGETAHGLPRHATDIEREQIIGSRMDAIRQLHRSRILAEPSKTPPETIAGMRVVHRARPIDWSPAVPAALWRPILEEIDNGNQG